MSESVVEQSDVDLPDIIPLLQHHKAEDEKPRSLLQKLAERLRPAKFNAKP